jgi:hypothetical protein
MSSKPIEKFFGSLAGKVNPLMSEQSIQASAERSDVASFKTFSQQEQSLLDNPTQELFMPAYKTNKNLAKQTEALAKVFNARKDEALARKTAPGIAQTRTRMI